jgi:outer membrane immunogenic protein
MIENIVKKLAFAGIAWIAGTLGSALAADLTPVYKAPVRTVVPVATWNGFYIGGNVGYGRDRGDTNLSAVSTDPVLAPALAAILDAGSYPGSLSTSSKGMIGGAQAGYNWQMSQWLFGLEADIQAAGIKGSANEILAPAFFDSTSTGVSKSIDWFGTVRARIGLLPTQQFLLYVTGGLAYGRTETSFSTTDVTSGCIASATICVGNSSSSGVRAGWTAGAGAEAMLTPNWSIKAEYLRIDLGSRSLSAAAFTVPAIVFTTSASFREDIARVGFNYHFN